MQQKKKCFVIMPMSRTKACSEAEWTVVFDQMIKPAVEEAKRGFMCERAKPRTGNLIKDILNELNTADVVIADLTDKNPNVFYELGVRHALGNRTILIAQDFKHVPSDLTSYWVIIYKKDLSGIQDFKDKIKSVMAEMKKNPDKSDSPVADFLGEKNIYLLSLEKSANIKKLTALVSELSYNVNSVDEVISGLKQSKEAQARGEGRLVLNVRFSNVCLTMLLSTRYIEFPINDTEELDRLNRMLMRCNATLELSRIESFSTTVEDRLEPYAPQLRQYIIEALRLVNRVRTEYMNNNYQEQAAPVVLLSSEDHKRYLETTPQSS